MAGSMSSSEPMGLAIPFYQNGQGHLNFDPQNGQLFAGQFISAETYSLFSPQQIQQLNSQITAYNQSILNLQDSMMVNGTWPFDFNPAPPGSLPPCTPILTPGFELPIIETSSDKNSSSMLFNSPSEIFEDVYLGTNEDAKNVEELKKMGIRHVLGVDRDVKMDLFKHWDDVFEYINKAKTENSKVLIHGETSTSCSAAVVIAYAMKAYAWGFLQALYHVKTRRSCIEPNRSLLLQLLNYEYTLEVGRTENNKLEIFDRSGSGTDKIELNKNLDVPMRSDTITIDDDSDDNIIEPPLSRIPSSKPEPNQQSSKATNQKRTEFCRYSEELSPPKKSTAQELLSEQQLRMPTGDIQSAVEFSIDILRNRKNAQRSKMIKNRNEGQRQRKINGYRKTAKINPRNREKYVYDYNNYNKMYNHRQSFPANKRIHTSFDRVTCEDCQKNYSNRSHLNEHKSRCNGGKNFECEHCQKEFVRKCNIVYHLKWCKSAPGSMHQKKYVCPFKGCDRVYINKNSYYSHRKTHDLAELITYEHEKQKGTQNPRRNSCERFQCDHCKRIFLYRSSIAAHLKWCERGCESGNRKKYACRYIGCDRVYNSHSSFRYHKQTHQPITCQYCQWNFSLPSHLKDHLDRCNGGKKFECDYCQRMFVNRPAIICHLNGCKQKKINDQKNVDKEVSTRLSEKNNAEN